MYFLAKTRKRPTSVKSSDAKIICAAKSGFDREIEFEALGHEYIYCFKCVKSYTKKIIGSPAY